MLQTQTSAENSPTWPPCSPGVSWRWRPSGMHSAVGWQSVSHWNLWIFFPLWTPLPLFCLAANGKKGHGWALFHKWPTFGCQWILVDFSNTTVNRYHHKLGKTNPYQVFATKLGDGKSSLINIPIVFKICFDDAMVNLYRWSTGKSQGWRYCGL